MYGLLGVLTARGWVSNEARSHLLLPVLLAMSVGAIDEIHQRYVPGRSSEFADFAADVAGVSVGFSLVARRRSMHNNGME